MILNTAEAIFLGIELFNDMDGHIVSMSNLFV
jgi:hypothetical protein